MLLADQAAARGERLSIALAAPTGKAATRLQEAVVTELAAVAESSPAAKEAADRVGPPRRAHAAPAAGLAARQQHPLPPRPHQPAQVRRGRGRRVLDGRAHDDGPAARGGAAPGPADPGRRPEAADLGRRRRGAQRPGRRLRRRPGLAGGRAHPQLPRPGGHQGAGRVAARRRRRRGARGAAGAVGAGRVRRGHRLRRGRGGAPVRLPRRRPGDPRRRAGRGCRGRDRGPRHAPPAVRAPRGTPRRTPLERAGRALARRDPGRRDLRPVVRRPPAPGDHQRLRPRRLQRRDRGGGPAGAAAAGVRGRVRAAQGVRAGPARRRRDDARDDHPQEPGQRGAAGHGAAARRRLAAAHPRAVLHRGHPGRGRRCGSSGPRPPSAPPWPPRRPGRRGCASASRRPDATRDDGRETGSATCAG